MQTPFPTAACISLSVRCWNCDNSSSLIPKAFAVSTPLNLRHCFTPSTSLNWIHLEFPIAVIETPFPCSLITVFGLNQSPSPSSLLLRYCTPVSVFHNRSSKSLFVCSLANLCSSTGSLKISLMLLLLFVLSGHLNQVFACLSSHNSCFTAIVNNRVLSKTLPQCAEFKSMPAFPSGPTGTLYPLASNFSTNCCCGDLPLPPAFQSDDSILLASGTCSKSITGTPAWVYASTWST